MCVVAATISSAIIIMLQIAEENIESGLFWSKFIEDSMLSLIGSAGAEICVKPSGGWSKFIEHSMLSLIGSAGAEICVKPSGGWSKFIEDSMLSLIGSGGAEILDI